MTTLATIELTVDELESLRLKDYQKLDQNDAAQKMSVSQPTFHRIVNAARNKVADALVNGKAIKIEGGNYIVETERLFKCYACGHEWSETQGTGRPSQCPACENLNIHRAPQDRGYARGGRGHRKGQRAHMRTP